MNLRKEDRINEQPKVIIETQPHLTILSLECNQVTITVQLSDSRLISIPTTWFRHLRTASQEQLNKYEIFPAGCGIHWEELDEDISIKSFINGLKGGCCH